MSSFSSPRWTSRRTHSTCHSHGSGLNGSTGTYGLYHPWSCQLHEFALVVHTAAPVALLFPILWPHRTHYISCHLPLCPWGPSCWQSCSPFPTAAHSSPSRPLWAWLSLPFIEASPGTPCPSVHSIFLTDQLVLLHCLSTPLNQNTGLSSWKLFWLRVIEQRPHLKQHKKKTRWGGYQRWE